MAVRIARSIAALLALPEDRRFLGAYRLERPLGKGGFAPVWLAKEVYGGIELRTVAVKIFALDDGASEPARAGNGGTLVGRLAAQQALRERIVAEARALCRVEHPNIVRFFAIGTEAANGNVLGLAMEYVHGRALDARLDEARTLPVGDVLAVGCAVASALAAVHQVGLVHRDIKPANVIDAAGVYKVIDFGIAAARASRARELEPSQVVLDDLPLEVARSPRPGGDDGALDAADTQLASGGVSDHSASGSGSGTAGYVDPACLAGAAPSPSSDLYSLGAMLFECLTGDVPAVAASRRKAESGLDADVQCGRARAPSLQEIAPDVPEPLAKIVDALLDPEPGKRPRSAEAVAWELERTRRAIAGRSRPLPPESKGPFRGLGRFEESDRDVLFGRSIEIAGALEMVRARGLVALVGPSGSGKSSLARAGLVPAIADGELGSWPKHFDCVVVTPGTDPRAHIAEALEPLVRGAGAMEPETLAVALAERVQRDHRGVLLLVDQLEELVTTADDDSRDWAVRLLARLGSQAAPGVRCVVAARRDLLDAILALPDLGRVVARGSLLVAPLTDAAWEEAIDGALGAYGYRLEDDAMRVELLAQLKGTSSAMPLVQFALTELWRRRDPRTKVIPHAALQAIGGIGGALEMHADATVDALARVSPDAKEIARGVLLELTTPQGTRATLPLAAIEARVPSPFTRAITRDLEDARILTREADGLTIAHEALLTRWSELARWVSDARGDRLRAQEIEREAASWEADKRSADRLLKGRRLAAAEELRESAPRLLGPSARALLRDSRRATRHAALFAAAPIAAVVLAAAGYGAVRWDAARVKESYCGNWVTRWQAPECIAPLARGDIERRSITHRFRTQHGHVFHIDRVNGYGEPREDDDGFASWDFRYDDEGRVSEIAYLDRGGVIRVREVFSDALKRRERRDRYGTPKPIPGTDATVSTLDYDARGFVTGVRYSNMSGSPRVDDAHAFGYAYQPDARGLIEETHVLGADGKPSPNGEGVVHLVRKYDGRGNIVVQTALDLENKPAVLATRVSTTRFTIDRYDREVDRAFFDGAGNAAMSKWGYARVASSYDDRGNRIRLAYYDADDQLVVGPDGYAGFVSTYDGKGNETEDAYFGVDERPIVTRQGFVRTAQAFDARGNVIEQRYFGLDGAPAAHTDGEAVWKKSYDERGNETAGAYYGLNGEPVTVASLASWTAKYDERDDAIEVAMFGVDGKPGLSSEGFARRVSTFDERGKELSSEYFGPDGAPILKQGYAKVVNRYDDHGNLVESRYFGVSGKPVLRQGGYARITSRYDERGNKIEDAFFGTGGALALWDGGYARRTAKFDARGKPIEEAYFGTDGEPLLVGGVARWTARYDDRGSETDRRFFGVDGKPITHPDGYAMMASTVDERGNVVERAYFGPLGKRALLKDGTAGFRAKYDEQNKEIEKSFFGLGGEPVRASSGYWKTTAKWSRQGDEVERAYFDIDGTPTLGKESYHRTVASYDPRGNELERRYFDAEGKPTLKDGAARVTTIYDAHGKPIEWRAFGTDDEPVVAKDGYARRVNRFDDRGNAIEKEYFDAHDRPVANKDGVAGWHAVFDGRGRMIEKSYFGPDGKPAAPDGDVYAKMVSAFDDRSLEIERRYYGTDGKPVLKDGAARWTATYDGNGQKTETRYFDAADKPVAIKDGYARIESTYDVYGHVLSSRVFAANGARSLGAEGWHHFIAKLDETGNEIEESFFGVDDKPIVTRKGFARTTARYDDAGREIEREYFGDGDRAVMAEGFARSLTRYDEHGYLLEQAWFGADGRPVTKSGYARRVAKYDRQGQEIEIAFYAPSGALVRNGDFARWTGRYDERGKQVESAFFGADDKPIVLADGYARFKKSYDEGGRHAETRYFGKTDAPAKQKDGVAVVRRRYDDWGNEIERAFYDENDKPTVHKSGVAGWRSKFDPFGHEVERAFFGVDGKYARLKSDGYARWTAKIDGSGDEIETAFYDENDKLVTSAAGYARVTAKYDERSSHIVVLLDEDAFFIGASRKDDAVTWRSKLEPRGSPIELAYFGPSGLPATTRDGYAMVTFKYDLTGNLTEKSFVDLTGAPAMDKKSGCATLKIVYDDTGRPAERTCLDVNGKATRAR